MGPQLTLNDARLVLARCSAHTGEGIAAGLEAIMSLQGGMSFPSMDWPKVRAGQMRMKMPLIPSALQHSILDVGSPAFGGVCHDGISVLQTIESKGGRPTRRNDAHSSL